MRKVMALLDDAYGALLEENLQRSKEIIILRQMDGGARLPQPRLYVDEINGRF